VFDWVGLIVAILVFVGCLYASWIQLNKVRNYGGKNYRNLK
tara:strand:- start:147 stop:269 length:123 start_codon:yes stop_codon:yes gene_type:complete